MSTVTAETVDSLVLGTVNASFKTMLDAETLAVSIETSNVDEWLAHVATFFAEVQAHLILAFAEAHAIPLDALAKTYAKIKALTGEFNRALDAELAGMAVTP